MVDSVLERGGCGWPANREVPFEEVGFQGSGGEVCARLGGELGSFFEDSFDGGGFGGHGWRG